MAPHAWSQFQACRIACCITRSIGWIQAATLSQPRPYKLRRYLSQRNPEKHYIERVQRKAIPVILEAGQEIRYGRYISDVEQHEADENRDGWIQGLPPNSSREMADAPQPERGQADHEEDAGVKHQRHPGAARG